MTEMEKLENVIRARWAYDSAYAAGRTASDLYRELIDALDSYGAHEQSHMQQAYAARLEEHQQYIKNERGE